MSPDSDVTDDHIQKLITVLLDRAIVASYTQALLRTLADTHPDDDSSAHADIAQAITTMQHVCATLIRDADRLGQLPRSAQARP
ncbi:hypothetical protein [Actinoplanes sp. URMC 104]|uniref:hypothetical protein n=1 Tax=Actinoplanes sp. URMC 104 TaxID=3423409 RepID=UPI003F1C9D81